jgi:DNA-binding protein H-NS
MNIHKKKIELLENKLREKSQIEHQLQNDIISLKREITTLKEKKNQNDFTDNILKRNDYLLKSPTY